MDLQLELLPYHYYNTLGFDVELIDYINHVDDSIVLEKTLHFIEKAEDLLLIHGSVFACITCILHALKSRRSANWKGSLCLARSIYMFRKHNFVGHHQHPDSISD
jgi:hypothetical protein